VLDDDAGVVELVSAADLFGVARRMPSGAGASARLRTPPVGYGFVMTHGKGFASHVSLGDQLLILAWKTVGLRIIDSRSTMSALFSTSPGH
jgi:hypothetical protein